MGVARGRCGGVYWTFYTDSLFGPFHHFNGNYFLFSGQVGVGGFRTKCVTCNVERGRHCFNACFWFTSQAPLLQRTCRDNGRGDVTTTATWCVWVVAGGGAVVVLRCTGSGNFVFCRGGLGRLRRGDVQRSW